MGWLRWKRRVMRSTRLWRGLGAEVGGAVGGGFHDAGESGKFHGLGGPIDEIQTPLDMDVPPSQAPVHPADGKGPKNASSSFNCRNKTVCFENGRVGAKDKIG